MIEIFPIKKISFLGQFGFFYKRIIFPLFQIIFSDFIYNHFTSYQQSVRLCRYSATLLFARCTCVIHFASLMLFNRYSASLLFIHFVHAIRTSCVVRLITTCEALITAKPNNESEANK